jgi:hypothetical protein
LELGNEVKEATNLAVTEFKHRASMLWKEVREGKAEAMG